MLAKLELIYILVLYVLNICKNNKNLSYKVSETIHISILYRKQSILEKNVSDKSEILNDPFNDLISLTFDGVTKVRAMLL